MTKIYLLISVLLFSVPASAQTHVQSALAPDCGLNIRTSIALTGNVVGSGNTVVGLVTYDTSNGALIGVVDDKGDTVTVDKIVIDPIHNQAGAAFHAMNLTTAPKTFTAQFAGNGASFTRIMWDEYSGLTTFSGVAGQFQSGAGTAANAVTSGPVSVPNVIYGTTISTNGGTIIRAGTGFLLRAGGGSATQQCPMASEDQSLAAPASIPATFTMTANQPMVTLAQAFTTGAPPPPPPPPVASSPPVISGTPQVGSLLTATNGVWTGSPTAFTYQWYSGVAIIGATSSSYTAQASDVGNMLSVAVTATNAGGSTIAVSAPTAAVTQPPPPPPPVPPVAASPPVITGTPQVGSVLTASSGMWSDAPTFAYQWYSNGNIIPGATTSSYTAQVSDVGNQLSVVVTATNTGGSAISTSAFTAAVIPAPTQSSFGPPSTVIATAVSSSEIDLTWTVVPGANVYLVFRNGLSVGAFAGVSFKDTGLTPATAYSYTVEAQQTSVPSGTVSATTQAVVTPPPPPVDFGPDNLVATVVSPTEIDLTWTAVQNAQCYQILRNGVQVGTSPTASFKDTTVVHGTTYSYSVAAVISVQSVAASATP